MDIEHNLMQWHLDGIKKYSSHIELCSFVTWLSSTIMKFVQMGI